MPAQMTSRERFQCTFDQLARQPPTDDRIRVLVGTRASNSTLDSFAKAAMPTEFTPYYPIGSNYAIRCAPPSSGSTNAHPAIIALVCGNTAGVVQGATNLNRLLTVENRLTAK